MSVEITQEKKLHAIRQLINSYAAAKGQRVQLEEYRKICKAQLMKKAELAGVKALQAQERDAYTQQEYRNVVEALSEATRDEAAALWRLRLEEWRFEAWRTEQANQRMEAKRYGN